MTRRSSSRPTIRDVARHAGVSLTTVSDVVNGKGRVDPSTRERVLKSVATVGWRPRRSARALRSGKSRILALCLPRRGDGDGVAEWLMSADYDMAFVTACAAAAVDADRQLLLTSRPRDAAEVAELDADGVIVVDPGEDDPILALLEQEGLPAVTIDRGLRDTDGWSVETDKAGSVRSLLDHLVGQDAERIALLGSDRRWAWFAETFDAYEDWCRESGVRPISRTIDPHRPRSSAATAVRALLRLKNPPDAIIAVPSGAPLGALDAITASGRSVPDDVLLAAAIDAQILQLSRPSITAVDLQPMAAARSAIDLLIRRADGETAGDPPMVTTALRVRESTSRVS